ncbi:MAG: hypothetical protein IJ719_22285 [Clostridia bacterium]|nr:hypothetical protein [Clostridia bacterium]
MSKKKTINAESERRKAWQEEAKQWMSYAREKSFLSKRKESSFYPF